MNLFQCVEDYTMKKLIKTMDDCNLKDSSMKIIYLQLNSNNDNELMDTLATETNMNADTLSTSLKTKTNKQKANNNAKKPALEDLKQHKVIMVSTGWNNSLNFKYSMPSRPSYSHMHPLKKVSIWYCIVEHI